jgi:hypothetical protein
MLHVEEDEIIDKEALAILEEAREIARDLAAERGEDPNVVFEEFAEYLTELYSRDETLSKDWRRTLAYYSNREKLEEARILRKAV